MNGDPRFAPPDPRDLDPRAVRRAFGRAAATYDRAAALQREVGTRMAERLDYVKIAPAAILDAGCGTGESLPELAARYPQARIVGLDFALPMLVAARERVRGGGSLFRRLLAPVLPAPPGGAGAFVCADFAQLPFPGVRFDLVWSNLTLQWVNDLPRVFAEVRRTLRVGGLFMFSTFGPDTLFELRAAFARADRYTHVNRFIDLHDVGDLLVAAGFADPVMDMERLTLTYAAPGDLMRELKAIGATNATRGRARGLTGPARLRRVAAELEKARQGGRIPATFEVVYGHAWKGEPRRTAEGHAIVKLPRPGARSG